jgi:hypothetical protein
MEISNSCLKAPASLPADHEVVVLSVRSCHSTSAGKFAGRNSSLYHYGFNLPSVPVRGDLGSRREGGFSVWRQGYAHEPNDDVHELTAVLAATPETASREDYAAAIVEGNCLGKATTATRRLSNQRLGELYGLDPGIPLFRVLRRLWSVDTPGRPLLALQCALARDPLLAATVSPVLALPAGSDVQRDAIRAALKDAVDERLSEATLDKVIRNVASSWEQAGHLVGRTFKKRALVRATPGSVAFGLYLGHAVGFRGASLFATGWVSLLDCTPVAARDLAIEAKRIGLIDLRIAGDVVDLALDRLDPQKERRS